MTIIGCDPSVSKTGLVIRREDGTYHSSLIKPPAKAQDPGRLYWIAATVVAECKLSPEVEVLLVIEHPTPKGQLDPNIPLHWRLREEFGWHYMVSTLKVWPSQVNKFAAPAGISEIGASVVQQWGHCLPNEVNPDILDALAMCKLGEMFLGLCEGTKDQMSVVRFEDSKTKKNERVAMDDRATFGICKESE